MFWPKKKKPPKKAPKTFFGDMLQFWVLGEKKKNHLGGAPNPGKIKMALLAKRGDFSPGEKKKKKPKTFFFGQLFKKFPGGEFGGQNGFFGEWGMFWKKFKKGFQKTPKNMFFNIKVLGVKKNSLRDSKPNFLLFPQYCIFFPGGFFWPNKNPQNPQKTILDMLGVKKGPRENPLRDSGGLNLYSPLMALLKKGGFFLTNEKKKNQNMFFWTYWSFGGFPAEIFPFMFGGFFWVN